MYTFHILTVTSIQIQLLLKLNVLALNIPSPPLFIQIQLLLKLNVNGRLLWYIILDSNTTLVKVKFDDLGSEDVSAPIQIQLLLKLNGLFVLA